jgi:predicted permease
MSNWFRRVWHLVNRSRRERELVREMNEHRASMREPSKFGDTYRLLEQSRDAWGWNWLDDAMQDLSVGVRSLMRVPSFTVTAVLILSFGIGLNLTFYQFIRAALLQPPAIKSVESWARFIDAHPEGSRSTVPYPLVEFVKSNNGVLAAVIVEQQAAVAWGQDASQQITATFVSPNWFDELGYGPLHGRMLSEAMDANSDIPAVVLSYTFWKNQLGADAGVVGSTAYLERKPVMIVGVAPANLPGMDFNVADAFIAITAREYFYPDSDALRAWKGDGGVDMYGRFREGVSAGAAREGLRATMQEISRAHPEIGAGHWLEPMLATRRFMRNDERTGILIVMSLIASLTALVLVVAAANLGNLVMSRATGRVRELGVRMALGARRTRIIRQLVIESVPLIALGVVGSLAFAAIAAQLISTQTSLPEYIDFSPDWGTVVAAIGLGSLALIVTGLIPACKVAQQHLIDAIKDGGHQVSQSLDRALMRRVLVAAQVAGSCVLLVVAGMMVRSVQRVVSGDLGFDYARAAVLEMPLSRHGATADIARPYWYAVKARALANPEVEQAAIVTAPPMGGRVFETGYNDTPGLRTMVQSVDPEYFDTMKIPILAGRVFRPDEAGTAVVSRRLAVEMYGTVDVLGRGFPKSKASHTIVGIAGDAHAIKVNATDVAELYLPLKLADFSEVFMVARARTNVDLLPSILREAGSMDSRVIPVAHVMREDFDSETRGPRIAGAITLVIGLMTLALASFGIFGVVSYGVALRTKEIGIRLALGARQPALLRVLVRNVLAPVAVGVILGLGAAAAVGAALRGEPFFLEHVDPIAFAGALIVLAISGTIAAVWPAVAVLRGNPIDALRYS